MRKERDKTISVVVIVYNVLPYLKECVESIRRQTYKDLEIILVDDGSTDRSGEFCEEFKALDSRIIVVHKPNGGLVSARKAGVDVATGAYCAFVDGDDWIDEDTYETMYQYVNRYSADIVAAGIVRNYPDKVIREKNLLPVGYYDKEKLIAAVYPRMMYDMERKACFIDPSLCNKLFKSKLIKSRFREIDEQIFYLGEDAATTYPILLRAETMYVTDHSMYHHRILPVVPGDASYKRKQVYERLLLFYKSLKKDYEKSKYANIVLPQLNGYFLHLLSTITAEAIGLNIFDFYHNLFYRDQQVNQSVTYESDIKYKINDEVIDKFQRVVLYGAGNVGKDYFYQLSKKGVIIYWVDGNNSYYKGFGLDVHPVTDIPKDDYDAYILATVKHENAKSMRKVLQNQGIANDKIIQFIE